MNHGEWAAHGGDEGFGPWGRNVDPHLPPRAGGPPVRLLDAGQRVGARPPDGSCADLPTRPLLMDHLGRSIVCARRNPDHRFAVVLVELDRSGEPGTGRPSPGAEGLLKAVAARLEACLERLDPSETACRSHLVARLRGDEFAVLLDRVRDAGDAQAVASRMLAEALAPFPMGDRQVYLAPSVGIALGGAAHARAEDVLRDADMALCRAKLLGKARCEIFDPDLATAAESQAALESDIRSALERGQFVLHFQPILALASNRIAGFEALVRWEHPSLGAIPPAEFIPMAERTGLITALGSWVLREACLRLKAWQERGLVSEDLWVSVNLASPHFSRPGLADQIAATLGEMGLGARRLMLELTESAAMENAAAIRRTIADVRAMGARVGLDDFGTGQSSLACLHQFPSDFLKLDRTFVRDLAIREDARTIVGAVIALARQLGLCVIAEGIETREQAELARALGCDYGQGFYFSHPLDQAGAADLLRAGFPPPAVTSAGGESAGEAAPPPLESGLLPFDLPSCWTGWARPPAFAPTTLPPG